MRYICRDLGYKYRVTERNDAGEAITIQIVSKEHKHQAWLVRQHQDLLDDHNSQIAALTDMSSNDMMCGSDEDERRPSYRWL